jgi:hypothetical protein
MQGMEYCRTECLERALLEILGQTKPPRRDVPASHRVPLGLLLLSRQQLSAEQLRAALEAQRKACGEAKPKKIGVWLQELGFTAEAEITGALARQWACPVLRSAPMDIAASRFPSIPTVLLDSYQMFPVELVETTRTLLMAFSERIDYTVLYAIEQMLRCRTQACVLSSSIMRKSLDMVAQRAGADVVFDRMESAGECARIIGSYTAKVKAEEVRMSRCGEHLWIRLERLGQEAVTLVLRAPFSSSQLKSSSQFSVPSSQFSIRTEASGR